MAGELTKSENWGELVKLFPDKQMPMPYVQEIFLLECEVAGVGFVEGIIPRSEKLADGNLVVLCREPDNKHDAQAIRCENAQGEKLGYVPRAKNEILSRLMDGGKMLYGKVAAKSITSNGKWVAITIKIYLRDL